MNFGTRRIEARVENLAGANEFVEECAGRFGIAAKRKSGMLLALEEAFVNICSHAYPGGEGEAEISCEGVDDTFVLEVADTGKPFDILSLPDPDITLDIMDRRVGGLGVHFIRKLSDRVGYRRESGRNILRMEFNRS